MLALVFNAILTLIAGSRLWAHVFWRNREDALLPEHIGPVRRALRYSAPAALVGTVIILGLWPNIMFAMSKAGAADLVDPARYIAAVGLGGANP
jgi:multicomponent Na+:H+ antiporter subunit D